MVGVSAMKPVTVVAPLSMRTLVSITELSVAWHLLCLRSAFASVQATRCAQWSKVIVHRMSMGPYAPSGQALSLALPRVQIDLNHRGHDQKQHEATSHHQNELHVVAVGAVHGDLFHVTQ